MAREQVEVTKEIKAANDIADVIGGYLPLHRNGPRLKCLCPFHNDTNPSLTIDLKRQSYKCWACGANGDVFTFVEKYERVNFMEARVILARRAGIALHEATPQDNHKSKLLDTLRWAQAVYAEEFINGKSGNRAREYISTRRLIDQSIRQFGLGFAPPENGWIERAAKRDGIAQELLIEVGLLGVREEGGAWDRFRDRVMFPIRDLQGRTIGFGGRILPDSPYAARSPKYYNTAETMLFSKSQNVFGIDFARRAAAETGTLAVVEGYTDVIMAHQCGIANVVATMGTALNERHIASLGKHAKRIVLVFDADDAGNNAMDKALDLFVASDLELSIAKLPPGLDPADLLAEPDGAVVFREALADAADALDFKLDQLLAKETRTVEGTRRMLDAILGVLALAPPVPNPATQMKRELMQTRLAQRLGLELNTVRARLRELQANRPRSDHQYEVQPKETVEVAVPAAPQAPAHPQQSVLERQLVQLLLAEPDLVGPASTQVDPDTITHSGIRRIVVELFALHASGSPADLDGLRIKLIDRPDLATAAMTLLEVGRGIPDRSQYLEKIVAGFARLKRQEASQAVRARLMAVADDESAALELLRELQKNSSPK